MIVSLKTLRLDELDVDPKTLADINATGRSDVSNSLLLDYPYVVYAIEVTDSGPLYFIEERDWANYPMWYHAPAFDVVDDRVSRYWTFQRQLPHEGSIHGDTLCRIGFPEWHEQCFYERLLDDERDALRAYRSYKKRINFEFALPGVTEEAEPLDETWVMCPACTESWQAEYEGEMTECPACHRYWLRPIAAE